MPISKTDETEKEIHLPTVNVTLVDLEKKISVARDKNNSFFKELGLTILPGE